MSQEECEEKVRRFIGVLREFCRCIGKRAESVGPPLPQLETPVTVSVDRLRITVDMLESEIRGLDREKKMYLCRMLDLSSVVELIDGLLKAEWAEASHSLSPAAHRWKGFERAGNILTSLGSGLANFLPGVGGLLQVFGDSISAICGIFGDHRADRDLSKQMEEMKKQLEAKIEKVNKDLKNLKDDLFKAWKYLEANMANLDARIVKVKKQLEEAIVELEDELYKLKHQLEAKIEELDKKNEERIRVLKDQLEMKIDGLKKQLENRLNKLEEELRGEFDSLRKQLDGLTGELTNMEKEIDGLKKQLDDVKNELGRTETRLMTAMDALERHLRMEISAVSSSLKGLSDRLDADLMDIRKRMESLKERIETLEKLCEELKKILEETSSEASGSGG